MRLLLLHLTSLLLITWLLVLLFLSLRMISVSFLNPFAISVSGVKLLDLQLHFDKQELFISCGTWSVCFFSFYLVTKNLVNIFIIIIKQGDCVYMCIIVCVCVWFPPNPTLILKLTLAAFLGFLNTCVDLETLKNEKFIFAAHAYKLLSSEQKKKKSVLRLLPLHLTSLLY